MRREVVAVAMAMLVGCAGSSAVQAPRDVTIVVDPPKAETASAPSARRTTDVRPEAKAVEWLVAEPEAVARASSERRPLLLNFGAAWCGACVELARKTYADPRFVAASQRFILVDVDATNDESPVVIELFARYRVRGLPTIIVIDSRSKERARFVDFVPPESLVEALDRVQ